MQRLVLPPRNVPGRRQVGTLPRPPRICNLHPRSDACGSYVAHAGSHLTDSVECGRSPWASSMSSSRMIMSLGKNARSNCVCPVLPHAPAQKDQEAGTCSILGQSCLSPENLGSDLGECGYVSAGNVRAVCARCTALMALVSTRRCSSASCLHSLPEPRCDTPSLCSCNVLVHNRDHPGMRVRLHTIERRR